MYIHRDVINKLIEEFNKTTKAKLDLVQYEKMKGPLQELSKGVSNIVGNISLDFLTEEMKKYIEETKEGTFPAEEHCFKIDDSVIEKLY